MRTECNESQMKALVAGLDHSPVVLIQVRSRHRWRLLTPQMLDSGTMSKRYDKVHARYQWDFVRWVITLHFAAWEPKAVLKMYMPCKELTTHPM